MPHARCESPAWTHLAALAAAPRPTLRELLASGHADRLAVGGLLFDWTRLGLQPSEQTALQAFAEAAGVADFVSRMAGGAVVNPSEGRAATHMALRDPANSAAVAPILAEAARLRGRGLTHLLHIGIGGSALGPALLLDSLGRQGDGPQVRVVANIDGEALARATADLDPATTGVIVVSKTFTTLETRTNLESALDWLAAGGVAEPMSRVTAVTAAPAKARAAGCAAILEFESSVGGRYSLWSAVGLPLAVRCGPEAFTALLAGAHAMDRHFLEAPFERNAPMRAAAADIWFHSLLGRPTRGLFAYDTRLQLLPAWLQQLEMESNGKSVGADGSPIAVPTAPIVWGGTGTDAQHAVFQLLHQGTHADPVEFVAVARPGHDLSPTHHRQLLLNCLAQGAALAEGRSLADALAASGGDRALAAARTFPGNRPSATILLDRLSPDRLGALLAFYEARVVAFAAFLGLNPFDQWGVELGKEIAAALSANAIEPDPATAALLGFIDQASAA